MHGMKSNFTENEFSLYFQFTSIHTGNTWILTNRYGPCQTEARTESVNWLQQIQVPDETGCMILGDFKHVRCPKNRSRPVSEMRCSIMPLVPLD